MQQTISSILETAAKIVYLKNNSIEEKKGFFVNPSELETEISAKWKNPIILGMGNTKAVYQNTEPQIWEFSIYLNANMLQRKGQVTRKQAVEAIQDFNNFLQACCFPVQSDFKGWVGGEPPLLTFVWPGVVSCSCRLLSVKFSMTQFDFNMAVCHEVAKIKLQSDFTSTYYYQDIRWIGGSCS